MSHNMRLSHREFELFPRSKRTCPSLPSLSKSRNPANPNPPEPTPHEPRCALGGSPARLGGRGPQLSTGMGCLGQEKAGERKALKIDQFYPGLYNYPIFGWNLHDFILILDYFSRRGNCLKLFMAFLGGSMSFTWCLLCLLQ